MPPLPVFLALLALVVLWASAFPVIKLGLEGLSVFHLALLRHLVSSLCFLPVLALTRRRLFPMRGDVPAFILLGSIGIGLYHTALNAGELRVSAGATSLIIATAPVITALLARLFLGERLPLLGWAGSLISFVGIAVIVLGDEQALEGGPYALLVLLSALSAAIYFVWQKPFFRRYGPLEVTAFATWGGTLPMLTFLPGLTGDMAGSSHSVLAAVYLGVLPSALAYSLLAFALSRVTVSITTAYLYLIPVFAMLFSWALLGEVPSLLTVLGGVVAIGGLVLVNLAKQQAARRAGTGGIRRGRRRSGVGSEAAHHTPNR